MERLANNWEPWAFLARDGNATMDSSPVQAWIVRSPRPDQELIDRLRELARAPYEAMPWPEAPNVDLGRLAADYFRMIGRRVEFSWVWEAYPHEGFRHVEVSVNGTVVDGCGEALHGGPESDLVAETDRLQSEQLGEEVDGDWPKCPHHRYIVMLPKNVAGIACWVCEVDSTHRVRIGTSANTPSDLWATSRSVLPIRSRLMSACYVHEGPWTKHSGPSRDVSNG
jgi:hypothetical protein